MGFVNTFLQLFLFFLTAIAFRACARHFLQTSFLHPSPRFLPSARTAGLRFGIFALFLIYPLIWASCGRRFAPAGSAHFFRQKAVQSAKPAFFMIFLISLLSFLCYNNLTICFNLCPCRGTGALRRASIRRWAAGFSLQRDTTEGRSYETGKRGNS